MSNRNDCFECRWQRSSALLTAYAGAQALALISLVFLEISFWAKSVGALACLLHGLHSLPRFILLSDENAYTGLRRDSCGWHLWSRRAGWQPVQLRPDSMALPGIVVLRFRLGGGWLNRHWVRAVCIPADAMPPELHRRLRLRLKFSRRRWAAPE
ncbi:protein YgfX [Pseudomonas sp. LP_7_YM]|uniref:protein YgfX n=1 Tax=Pseudomonas sp. LP_7_YM TaxID=2485137 RepID=UPI00105CF3BB|nr:protein YgfX [Pseudomonas sp. LP_7_YM]